MFDDFVNGLVSAPLDLNVRYSVFYICCSILIAFLIWRYRGSPGSFIKWLVPKEVYTHKSNLLDIKLVLASRIFAATGVFGAVFFPTAIAYAVLSHLGDGSTAPPPTTWASGFFVTLIVVVTSDFCKYWAHRAHHEWKFLWPFHAVHHSADVLTPLTVQRVHPVEPIIRNILITCGVGIVQGLVLFALVGRIDIVTIGGANAFYFLFNALGANFRHSHIWISYGPIVERILISPAQHQIHHSVATEHHDKNYGSIFALWDWMFGTLYIPSAPEKLTFGVSDGTGKPAAQPYPTLVAALTRPFLESWHVISQRLGSGLEMTQRYEPPAMAMSQGFSLWLDALRAGAALTVLLGHIAHVRFTRGDYYVLREWNVASDAVAVFFLLSGVVIAYAAGRDQTLGQYAYNRLTRIATVLIPALLLTLVFDAIGTRIDPSAYPQNYYHWLPLGEFLWRGMTVTNLWTGVTDWVRLGTNGPIWSLSYEVGFYLIFGSMVFLKGLMRVVMITTLVILVGLPILVMFPAWMFGVWFWKMSNGIRPNARNLHWILALGSILVLIALKISGAPEAMESWTQIAMQPHNHHAVLVYSNEVLWNTVIAACIALHLAGVKHLVVRWSTFSEGRVARVIRWIAGGSFSLYIVHYPTLHLLDATLPESMPGYDVWLLGITLAVCFAFAALFERPLKRYRMLLELAWSSVGKVRTRSA